MATSITSAARRACFAISGRSKCGKGCPCLRTRRRAQLRALADGAGTVWRTLQPADRVSFGEVDLVVHHPPRARMGAPARAQRRLRGARDSLRRRVVRLHRRHRQGSGADDRAVVRPRAHSHPEGAAPRQRDVELAERFSTRSGPTSPSSAPAAGTHSATRCRACWSGTGTSARRSTGRIRTGR